MLGARLKLIRDSKGLTLKAFASALGTSAGFISEVENGKKMPGFELIDSLKRIFDVDLNWFLTGEEKTIVEEEHLNYGKPDPVKEKINQHLEQMDEEAKRDVLKYAEEKELLRELMAERQKKRG